MAPRSWYETLRNGNTSLRDLSPRELVALAEALGRVYNRASLVGNITTMSVQALRGQAGSMMDPRRDIEAECGFPAVGEAIDPKKWANLHSRCSSAARVNEVFPKECWQVAPEVYEVEEEEEETEFEQAWKEVNRSLRSSSGLPSYYAEDSGSQQGSPIWEACKRLDEQAGIGQYGVMLLGFSDVTQGAKLNQPVRGLKEVGSYPSSQLIISKEASGNGEAKDSQVANREEVERQRQRDMSRVWEPYSLVANAGVANAGEGEGSDGSKSPLSGEALPSSPSPPTLPGLKLQFLRVFPEHLAKVTRLETNPTSPRYGQPVEYQVTLSDPRYAPASGMGVQLATALVHWTRIIHLPSDPIQSSEVWGTPRCQPVLEHILSLRKIYASDGEGYWRQAFGTEVYSTHPQLGGDVEVDEEAMRDKIEEMINSMQRSVVLSGMDLKNVGPALSDPMNHVQVQIDAICIKLNIPKRIYMGSERGELSSSQDEGDWNDELRGRWNGYLIPRLVVSLADRLIWVGILPRPQSGAYKVYVPDIAAQSELQRAQVAATRTSTLIQYVSGGGDTLIQPLDFLTSPKFMGLSKDEAQAILDHTREAVRGDAEQPGEETGTGASPLLGLVGGITGIIELFKQRKEGVITPDELRKLVKLFYKVDDTMAEKLISEQGLAGTPAAPAPPPEAPSATPPT